MNLDKILRIARREFNVNVRRGTYLFTTFGLPIFIVVLMGLVFGLTNSAIDDTSRFKRVGIVDESGLIPSNFVPDEPFVLLASRAIAESELAARTLDGYYVVGKDYLTKNSIAAYYNQESALNDGLQSKVLKAIKAGLAQALGNEDLAARFEDPLKEMKYYRVGSSKDVPEGVLLGTFLVALGISTAIFTVTMSTSQFLISGLAEEKENRMMELFITSARPAEMMWGKLLGMGLLGITQVVAWITFAVFFAGINRTINLGEVLAVAQVTPDYVAMALIYTLLTWLLYGSILAGIGAVTNSEQESRQYAGIISLIPSVPYFATAVFLTDPNGGLATFLSLFPFTASVAMPMRASFTAVPASQVLLSFALMLAAIGVIMFIASRIFRLAMLNYGRQPNLFRLLRAVFSRRAQAFTSSSEEIAASAKKRNKKKPVAEEA
jgi:ABC-2 type transport system permease protein